MLGPITTHDSNLIWIFFLFVLADGGAAAAPASTHSTVYVGHLSPRTERRDVEELVRIILSVCSCMSVVELI